MLGFIIRRVVWTIPVLLVTTLLAFTLVKQLPAEPFSDPRIPASVRENLRQIYGLDEPAWKQYVSYVGRLVQGDLGRSVRPGAPEVRSLMFDTLPASMMLGTGAFLLALVVGTVIGVFSALYVNTWIDALLLLVSTAAFAVPIFIVCVYWVEYLPYDWDVPWQRIGPITVLGLGIVPYFTRLVRASMLETLQSEFVTAARSKGLPWARTVTRHVLRNSLIPMVTNAGPLFGFALTGSFLVEFIMAVPGVNYDFVRAFRGTPDTYLVLNSTVLLAFIIIFVNLVVDILVAWLDPRISHD